jgi:hypothetical protein
VWGNPKHKFLAAIVPYFVTGILSAVIVASLFRPWKIDLRVPFDNDGDAHLQQMVIKNFVENGHFYVNAWLGAPGQQELYDFPLPHWTHVMVWTLLRPFTHDYGVLLNLYFFLTFPLCGFTALYAFRRLGISTAIAIAGAILFVILPFHLLRRESHLFLSSLYTLPLACMVVIQLAIGTPLFGLQLPADVTARPAITRDGIIALVSCVLVGWDNAYWAFFTAGFLLVGGLLGSFRNGHRRSLLSAVILCAVVTAALLTALSPNIIYFHKHGRVPVAARPPAESEMSPVTIIQMIAPVANHRIPFLAHLRKYYDSHGVMVNENFTATLGLFGSIGLLLSFAALFRKRCSEFLYSLGVLNLWAVLVGTMGGFGAVFAFSVSPQIRAYNRISVYIGFFSIAALLWAVDQWLRSRSSTSGAISLTLVPVVLVAIAVLDQIPRHFLTPRSVLEAEFHDQDAFVGQIERSVSANSMIFQLPYMDFPEHGSINKMEDYSQLVGYLHSKVLRWSYGAMHYRPPDPWLEQVSSEPPDQMIKSITESGFVGIFIDRFGYADNAASLEAQLRLLLGSQPITDAQGRYLFFRLAR